MRILIIFTFVVSFACLTNAQVLSLQDLEVLSTKSPLTAGSFLKGKGFSESYTKTDSGYLFSNKSSDGVLLSEYGDSKIVTLLIFLGKDSDSKIKSLNKSFATAAEDSGYIYDKAFKYIIAKNGKRHLLQLPTTLNSGQSEREVYMLYFATQ